MKQIVIDVERFARRRPAMFLGGAFALGIVAALALGTAVGMRPPAETEDAWMGETRDSLVEQAQETAKQTVQTTVETTRA